ncbi:hypothetical protein BC835DRAFT_1423536 [Cytidiella melzeri]|nr:hypothetical protein BC835DRAFT_1423536 [Cytidiella melzeri]
MQATSGESLRNALNVLDDIDSKTDSLRVLHDPSHTKMPQYSASIFDVRDYCDGTTVWINLYRQRVMLAETRLVDSVQSLVDDTCPGLLQNRVVATRDNNWVAQLTMNVLITVRAGLPITARSTEYFPPTVLRPAIFYDDPGEVRKRKYIHADLLSLYRASAVLYHRCLVDVLGTGCLLLPDIWNIYVDPPSWLFDQNCPKLSDANCHTDIRFNPQYLESFTALISEITADGTVQHRMTTLQQSYINLYSHVDNVPNRPPPPQSLPTANTSTAALSIPEQSSNAIAGSSTTASSIPSTSSSVRAPLSCIIDFLEDACVVATSLANGRTAPSDVSAAQGLMYKKPDFLLPLREAAPSRSIMNNLLDQTVWYIHFNTEAFVQCPDNIRQVQFRSPGEYNDYLQALFQKFSTHPQDSKFFCNVHALGQPIASCTLNRYTDYWEVANSNDIAWPPSRNFAHAMRDIHKYKLGLGEGKKHLLEGAGDLSEYMLLADMHAAGVVDSPTPDVVGRLVASLAKGGVAGLILLGYTAKGAGRFAVQSAFVKFYEDMRSQLSEDQLQRMQWNPITAEHTLCKFSRMYKKRCYTS